MGITKISDTELEITTPAVNSIIITKEQIENKIIRLNQRLTKLNMLLGYF